MCGTPTEVASQVIKEIEDLMPFERDIYSDMLIEYLKKEKERLEPEYKRRKIDNKYKIKYYNSSETSWTEDKIKETLLNIKSIDDIIQ